jgi:hypothetical protein
MKMNATSGSPCSTPPKTGKELVLLTHCIFTVIYDGRMCYSYCLSYFVFTVIYDGRMCCSYCLSYCVFTVIYDGRMCCSYCLIHSAYCRAIDLLDWHNLLEVNISLAKLLRVPNPKVCRFALCLSIYLVFTFIVYITDCMQEDAEAEM